MSVVNVDLSVVLATVASPISYFSTEDLSVFKATLVSVLCKEAMYLYLLTSIRTGMSAERDGIYIYIYMGQSSAVVVMGHTHTHTFRRVLSQSSGSPFGECSCLFFSTISTVVDTKERSTCGETGLKCVRWQTLS